MSITSCAGAAVRWPLPFALRCFFIVELFRKREICLLLFRPSESLRRVLSRDGVHVLLSSYWHRRIGSLACSCLPAGAVLDLLSPTVFPVMERAATPRFSWRISATGLILLRAVLLEDPCCSGGRHPDLGVAAEADAQEHGPREGKPRQAQEEHADRAQPCLRASKRCTRGASLSVLIPPVCRPRHCCDS